MNQPLFWRSLGVQALAVTVLFAALLALPLDRDFFRDWGALIGPVAWAVCSLVTARVLSLPRGWRCSPRWRAGWPDCWWGWWRGTPAGWW